VSLLQIPLVPRTQAEGFVDPRMTLRLNRPSGKDTTTILPAPATRACPWADAWDVIARDGNRTASARYMVCNDTLKPSGIDIPVPALCGHLDVAFGVGCANASDVVTWVVDSKSATFTFVGLTPAQNPPRLTIDLISINAANGDSCKISARVNGDVNTRFGPQINLVVNRSFMTTTLPAFASGVLVLSGGVSAFDPARNNLFSYPATGFAAGETLAVFPTGTGISWNALDEYSFVITQIRGATHTLTVQASSCPPYFYIGFPDVPGPSNYAGTAFSVQVKILGVNVASPFVLTCTS